MTVIDERMCAIARATDPTAECVPHTAGPAWIVPAPEHRSILPGEETTTAGTAAPADPPVELAFTGSTTAPLAGLATGLLLVGVLFGRIARRVHA